jgi:hypothetical protein
MASSIRTDIRLVNLKNQRVIEQRIASIEFEPEFMRYTIDFDAKEPINPEDKELGWHQVRHFNEIIVFRHSIATIEMILADESRFWRISVTLINGSDDMRFYFKYADRLLAEELRDQIIKFKNNEL